jgi:hypothetical protein
VNLKWDIAELLASVEKPGIRPLIEQKELCLPGGSLEEGPRVVADTEHHEGEMFPRVGFIVTNLEADSRWYGSSTSGAAKQWINRGKRACHDLQLRERVNGGWCR